MQQLINRLLNALMSFVPFFKQPTVPVKPMPGPPPPPGPPQPAGPHSFMEWAGGCRADAVAAFKESRWNDIFGTYLHDEYPSFLARADVAAFVKRGDWTTVNGEWLLENEHAFTIRADVHSAIVAGRWVDVIGEYIKESPLAGCVLQPPPGIGPTPPPPDVPPHPVTGGLGSGFASFKAVYDNKFVNVSKNPYGAQCVELCNAWCDWWHIERFPGNASDFEFDSHPDCDWIPNTPTNIPMIGDIVVWGKSGALPFGHVGIFDYGDVNTLTTFDQNWPFNTPAHLQKHSYVGVRGWLRPLVGDNAHGR